VAPTEITVLLRGDSGTGKELFAQAIHALSRRADKALVAIDCGAIPASLIESELFCYEKGAFTGAVKQTIGQIEMAEGNTLFLDEIGDLSYDLQVKILRFLQERVIKRVGGNTPTPVDTRIICATHKNLEDMIAEGTFREDLFYRISDMSINIPSLRYRESDVMVLAIAFLDKFSREFHCQRRSFSPDAILVLESHRWPGNMRELESKMKRAIVMADNGHITAKTCSGVQYL
jgi:two-component system NtrC family response regulator